MGSPFGRVREGYVGFGPAHVEGVEDVDVVVVDWAISSSEYEQFFANGRRSHGS